MDRDQRFRSRERLRLRSDFARVFSARCSVGNELLTVYAAPNGLDWSRLGISVSKRVGKATERNYVRRRIREAFRTHKPELPTGYDVVCVARPRAKERSADVAQALHLLFGAAVRRYRHRSGALRKGTKADRGGT